jgi:riboflavin synthase
MFTGIVEELGYVVAMVRQERSAILTIGGPDVTADAAPGASISVNGVCLTATSVKDGTFTADVMNETLRRTSLGALQAGTAVNLERPLPMDGRFDGHIVQGHVDGTGTIISRGGKEPDGVVLRIGLPPGLSKYVVEEGSVAVDGVSLTVIAVSGPADGPADRPAGGPASGGPHLAPASATAPEQAPETAPEAAQWFEVSLIPSTLKLTTLGGKQPGDPVNLEVDIISKYVIKRVETLLNWRAAS